MHPLLPSIRQRPDRTLPRLRLGITDLWVIALGAAVEPISGAFDPRYSAMLQTRAGQQEP